MRNRLVTVRGPPGIGKTSLCKQVARFMVERHCFPDGVLYVSMRDAFSLEAVLTNTLRELQAQDSSSTAAASGGAGSREGGVMPSDGEGSMSGASHTPSRIRQRVTAWLGGVHILVVLDNFEDPLNGGSGSVVRSWLQQLLEACPQLSVLLNSRQSVGGGLAGVTEKVYNVRRLTDIDAARLFMRLAPRQIQPSELFGPEGVDPSCLRLHAGGSSATSGEQTGGGSGVGGGGGNGGGDGASGTAAPRVTTVTVRQVCAALAKHPIMRFLDGHPQAISLATPLLQDRQLPEVAAALRTHGVESLRVEGIGNDERSAMNTLVVSLEVSIDHLRRRNPNAVALFCLMGLLPGGALDSDFDSIWGTGEGLLRVVSWSWPRVVSPVKPTFPDGERFVEHGYVLQFFAPACGSVCT